MKMIEKSMKLNKRKKSNQNNGYRTFDNDNPNRNDYHNGNDDKDKDNDRTRLNPNPNRSIIINNNYASSNQSIKSISIVFLIFTAIGICLLSILIPHRFLNPNLHKAGGPSLDSTGTTTTPISTNAGIARATECGTTTTTGVAAIDFVLKKSINYANLMKRLLRKLGNPRNLANILYVRYIRHYYRKIFVDRFRRPSDNDDRQNKKNRYDRLEEQEEANCFKTCKIEIVESIPENLTLLLNNDIIDDDTDDDDDETSSSTLSSSSKAAADITTIKNNETSSIATTISHAAASSISSSYQQQREKLLLSISTFEAWKQLLGLANTNLDIAAYKSSLRGKHVVDSMVSPSTAWGEEIFERLLTLHHDHKVRVRMVENYPPRDRGDNEDGISLEKRGVIDRRPLYYSKIFGTPGAMHSKFLLVDNLHFYLGSANFDWRSLNQKLEIGVLVLDCPCLAKDLRSIFNTYWALTKLFNATSSTNKFDTMDKDRSKEIWQIVKAVPTRINMHRPLKISHMGVPTSVYLAASPVQINGEGRTWDLDAILDVINHARDFIYINVMDYVPMFIYREPKRYWPIIDDAIRKAVVERRIELKIICAALHYVPENLFFLKSLQALNGITGKHGGRGGVEIKIFHVPAMTEFQSIIARDRRTHRKFMVTEDTVVIGTSNWSGDYFTGSTGVQIVIKQNSTKEKTEKPKIGPFVRKIRKIFHRDWTSDYAHDLTLYMQICLDPTNNLHIINNNNNKGDERSRRMCAPVRK